MFPFMFFGAQTTYALFLDVSSINNRRLLKTSPRLYDGKKHQLTCSLTPQLMVKYALSCQHARKQASVMINGVGFLAKTSRPIISRQWLRAKQVRIDSCMRPRFCQSILGCRCGRRLSACSFTTSAHVKCSFVTNKMIGFDIYRPSNVFFGWTVV